MKREIDNAANGYLHKWDVNGVPTTSFTWDDMVDCFRAGAELQKQQMMKETVEVEVTNIGILQMGDLLFRKNIQAGDKVKLIVLKSEE